MGVNEALRSALIEAKLTYRDVAYKVGVDEKTVQRWVTKGRRPYPVHQGAVAELLGKDVHMLWPEAVRRTVKVGADRELLGVFARRADLPRSFYGDLISRASSRLWFGGYTSYFIWVDAPQAARHLAEKAPAADVRFMLGDPESPVTRARDEYEASRLTLTTRIGMTLDVIQKTGAADKIDVRFTDKHVAWSVWVFDDDAVMTTHIGPGLGHDSLTMHWRRVAPGGAFDRLVEHFECLWETARPAVSPAELGLSADG